MFTHYEPQIERKPDGWYLRITITKLGDTWTTPGTKLNATLDDPWPVVGREVRASVESFIQSLQPGSQPRRSSGSGRASWTVSDLDQGGT